MDRIRGSSESQIQACPSPGKRFAHVDHWRAAENPLSAPGACMYLNVCVHVRACQRRASGVFLTLPKGTPAPPPCRLRQPPVYPHPTDPPLSCFGYQTAALESHSPCLYLHFRASHLLPSMLLHVGSGNTNWCPLACMQRPGPHMGVQDDTPTSPDHGDTALEKLEAVQAKYGKEKREPGQLKIWF